MNFEKIILRECTAPDSNSPSGDLRAVRKPPRRSPPSDLHYENCFGTVASSDLGACLSCEVPAIACNRGTTNCPGKAPQGSPPVPHIRGCLPKPKWKPALIAEVHCKLVDDITQHTFAIGCIDARYYDFFLSRMLVVQKKVGAASTPHANKIGLTGTGPTAKTLNGFMAGDALRATAEADEAPVE